MAKYEIIDGGCIIPQGTTIIEHGAFKNCNDLVKVVIPDSVTWINPMAFFGCTNLKEIVLPKSVKDIEYNDPHGVFSISESKPFPLLIPNLVNKGFSVQLSEDREEMSWRDWN